MWWGGEGRRKRGPFEKELISINDYGSSKQCASLLVRETFVINASVFMSCHWVF